MQWLIVMNIKQNFSPSLPSHISKLTLGHSWSDLCWHGLQYKNPSARNQNYSQISRILSSSLELSKEAANCSLSWSFLARSSVCWEKRGYRKTHKTRKTLLEDVKTPLTTNSLGVLVLFYLDGTLVVSLSCHRATLLEGWKLQTVSTIKMLLSRQSERLRAKKAVRGILECVPKVELRMVNLTRQKYTSALYGHMAQATSVRFTLQSAPHRSGMSKTSRRNVRETPPYTGA
jgi:hypothetical protein